MFMLSKSVVHGELCASRLGPSAQYSQCVDALISDRLPLCDEIRKRMLTFIQSCLLSDSDLVSFVTRHAVWFGRMSSPLGRNAFHCCRWFDVYMDGQVTLCHSPFCILHLES